MKQRIILILLALFSFTLMADYEFEDPSTGDSGQNFARVTFTDTGNQYITSDGTFDSDLNLPITPGGILQTQYRSFMEVELIDGSRIQINGNSRLEFQAINDVYNEESLTVINLERGSLFFHITPSPEWLKNRLYRIDTSHGSIYLQSPGLYRIDQKSYQMKLYVYRGLGEIAGEQDSTMVRSGTYSAISNFGYPNPARAFNSYYKDSFTSWAYTRNPIEPGASAQYVPPEISRYSYSLDSSGSWRYSASLGTHIWVPVVENSWRPYYDGYWSQCGSNLSWVGHNNWSWVTGHYGRWGWDVSFGWYWIPRRLFAPAWVAWTVIDGLLGWTPLGHWNRPFYCDNYGNNTVIVNHFHNTWVYRNPDRITVRNYHDQYRVPRTPRSVTRYTSRAIRVDSSRRSNPAEYTRAVLKPRSANRSTVKRQTQTRAVSSRNLQPRATSRYKSDTGSRTYSRTQPASQGTTRTKAPRTTTRSSSSSTSPRSSTQPRATSSQSRTTSQRSTSSPRQSTTRNTSPKSSRHTDRVTTAPRRVTSSSAAPRKSTSTSSNHSSSSTRAPSRQSSTTTRSSSSSTHQVPAKSSSSRSKPVRKPATSSHSRPSSTTAPVKSAPVKPAKTKAVRSTNHSYYRPSSSPVRTHQTYRSQSYTPARSSQPSSQPARNYQSPSRNSTRTQTHSNTASSSSSASSSRTRTSSRSTSSHTSHASPVSGSSRTHSTSSSSSRTRRSR